jgi:hypothetical protein
MNLGLGFAIVELERQEAVDRAMARYRAQKAQKERRVTASPRNAAPGRGLRSISKEEAIALIAKKHPRSALKLLHQHFGGRAVRGR